MNSEIMGNSDISLKRIKFAVELKIRIKFRSVFS